MFPPPPPSKTASDSIGGRKVEGARGQCFRKESARRNSDAEIVLAAIERIAAFVRRAQNQEAHGSFRAEIKELAEIIAQARREFSQDESQNSRSPSEIFIAAERIQESPAACTRALSSPRAAPRS